MVKPSLTAILKALKAKRLDSDYKETPKKLVLESPIIQLPDHTRDSKYLSCRECFIKSASSWLEDPIRWPALPALLGDFLVLALKVSRNPWVLDEWGKWVTLIPRYLEFQYMQEWTYVMIKTADFWGRWFWSKCFPDYTKEYWLSLINLSSMAFGIWLLVVLELISTSESCGSFWKILMPGLDPNQ